jgi:hypothetical protein
MHPVRDLTPYVGTYRSNQLRVDLSVVDGQLEEKLAYEPLDDVQERIFTRFAGGSFRVPPRRLYPLARTSSRRSGCRCRHSTVIRANFSSHSMVSANAVRTIGVQVVA